MCLSSIEHPGDDAVARCAVCGAASLPKQSVLQPLQLHPAPRHHAAKPRRTGTLLGSAALPASTPSRAARPSSSAGHSVRRRQGRRRRDSAAFPFLVLSGGRLRIGPPFCSVPERVAALRPQSSTLESGLLPAGRTKNASGTSAGTRHGRSRRYPPCRSLPCLVGPASPPRSPPRLYVGQGPRLNHVARPIPNMYDISIKS